MLEVDYTSARHAMNPEQNYSPFEIGLGQARQLRQGATTSAAAPSRPSRRRGGPARRLVGLQLDWYDIEGLFDAQGLPPAISPLRRPLAGPRLRGRPPGRQGDLARLEPDPQAGASPSPSCRPRYERVGHEAPGGVDGRGPPRPGRRDGRRAAVPRPRPQARMTAATRTPPRRLRGLRPPRRGAPRALDGRSSSSSCAIPSEGGDAAGLRAAADWTADRLRRAGATVEVLEVDGAPPLVVGRDRRRAADADRRPALRRPARARRSSCGRRRRTSPRSATAASGRAARPTTRASSCRASGRVEA